MRYWGIFIEKLQPGVWQRFCWWWRDKNLLKDKLNCRKKERKRTIFSSIECVSREVRGLGLKGLKSPSGACNCQGLGKISPGTFLDGASILFCSKCILNFIIWDKHLKKIFDDINIIQVLEMPKCVRLQSKIQVQDFGTDVPIVSYIQKGNFMT